MQLSSALNSAILLRVCSSFVFTNANYDGIQVGVPFTLTWEDGNGPVALGLLYSNTSSSAQETSIIRTNITASNFVWTPPDWTAGVFAPNIEAQDSTSLTLTGNFTIAKAVTASASSSLPAKIATSQPTSSSNSSIKNENVSNRLEIAAKARIGFGICIVVVLVIIGVALIFFEHGKRVAAKSEQLAPPKSPFGRAEHGLVGLELVETQGIWKKKDIEDEGKMVITEETFNEPSTPLLLKKKPERELVVELDGGLRGTEQAGSESEVKAEVESAEERRKRILSVRSIYELG